MNNAKPFVTETEFSSITGLSRPTINKLRKQGIIPWFGRNPVRIPLEAACEALTEYARKTTAIASAAAEKEG